MAQSADPGSPAPRRDRRPGAIRLRDAVGGEVRLLEDLQRRASLVWDDYREQLLAHPEAIELPPSAVTAGLVRVAVDPDGVLLGFSAVLPIRGAVCELDGLFVEPASWVGGVGRALIDDVADRAGRAGARWLEVIANPRAIGFYERTGFVVVERATTRFGPAPRMRRKI